MPYHQAWELARRSGRSPERGLSKRFPLRPSPNGKPARDVLTVPPLLRAGPGGRFTMTRPAAIGRDTVAVIDVEATGIYPGGTNRVIEVAVVRMSPQFPGRRRVGNAGQFHVETIVRTTSTASSPPDVPMRRFSRKFRLTSGPVCQAPSWPDTNLRSILGSWSRVERFRRPAASTPSLSARSLLPTRCCGLSESKARYCCEQVGIPV